MLQPSTQQLDYPARINLKPVPGSLLAYDAVQHAVGQGMENAAATLSEMTGRPIDVATSVIELISLPDLAATLGSPDEPAVGVYVGIVGGGSGYLLLLMEQWAARNLAGWVLGEEAGNIVLTDSLSLSALAEAANVACSSFMNAVGEVAHLRLEATPPVVLDDMRGAIMDVAAAELASYSDDVLVVRTELATPGDAAGVDSGGQVGAYLVALPTPEMYDRLKHCLLPAKSS